MPSEAKITEALPEADIKNLPKIMLHDHLDGGVRVETLIELAEEIGYKNLPTHDATDLQEYILKNSARGSLALYLETFDHTIAVMQTPESIERIAYECGEDAAKDGIVYIESRMAPIFCTTGTENTSALTLDEAMQAMQAGFMRASKEFNIQIKMLVSGMKQMEPSTEIAELAVKFAERDGMVVGFDLAGPEIGFFSSDNAEAIKVALDGGLGLTLHAGEAAGLDSIADAIECGAQRLGHGVRIMDDIQIKDTESASLGELATKIKEEQIPLEVCPTSNLHTGISDKFETHPLLQLFDAGFKVTLNTDNRLMSKITLSDEFINCQKSFGWGETEFQQLTQNALESVFCSPTEKETLSDRINSK